MSHAVGRYLPLSPARRFVGDLVHFAKQVPTVPMQRRMSLADVVAARKEAPNRPSWCSIFAKAFAVVAARRPELRRAYISFPYPRLYEHPISVASVAIERRLRAEEAVLFAHIRAPDQQNLQDMDVHLRRCKECPIEEFGLFRRIERMSRLPRPVRRFMWWYGLNTSGARRAKHLGTFGISVTAGLGAASLHQLSPLTIALNYSVFEENGRIDVRLVYDHRVLDGGGVARALGEIEEVLHQDIVTELRGAQPRIKINDDRAVIR
jgi:hypothetical protein